jgi:aspartate-semialdehyde dehydrogenase
MPLKAAVLGATGMVGQRFIQFLDGHPQFTTHALFASKESAGRRYGKVGKWTIEAPLPDEVSVMEVEELTVESVRKSGADLVFSALPSAVAGPIETELVGAGIPVFTNAAPHRMDAEVPLLIPEVNAPHLALARKQVEEGRAPLIANANCSVTGLVMGLKPLANAWNIRDVVVSTYQAVTGAGNGGLELLKQPYNVIPYISKEEHKMETESRKIMGRVARAKVRPADFSVLASCARVWVRDGHLESVVVTLDEEPSVDEVKAAFRNWESEVDGKELRTAPERPLVLFEDDGRPQPALDAMLGASEGLPGMAAAVGQVRVAEDGRVRFFVLSNNTIRGSAGGSVMNAELALAEGLLGK